MTNFSNQAGKPRSRVRFQASSFTDSFVAHEFITEFYLEGKLSGFPVFWFLGFRKPRYVRKLGITGKLEFFSVVSYCIDDYRHVPVRCFVP